MQESTDLQIERVLAKLACDIIFDLAHTFEATCDVDADLVAVVLAWSHPKFWIEMYSSDESAAGGALLSGAGAGAGTASFGAGGAAAAFVVAPSSLAAVASRSARGLLSSSWMRGLLTVGRSCFNSLISSCASAPDGIFFSLARVDGKINAQNYNERAENVLRDCFPFRRRDTQSRGGHGAAAQGFGLAREWIR